MPQFAWKKKDEVRTAFSNVLAQLFGVHPSWLCSWCKHSVLESFLQLIEEEPAEYFVMYASHIV